MTSLLTELTETLHGVLQPKSNLVEIHHSVFRKIHQSYRHILALLYNEGFIFFPKSKNNGHTLSFGNKMFFRDRTLRTETAENICCRYSMSEDLLDQMFIPYFIDDKDKFIKSIKTMNKCIATRSIGSAWVIDDVVKNAMLKLHKELDPSQLRKVKKFNSKRALVISSSLSTSCIKSSPIGSSSVRKEPRKTSELTVENSSKIHISCISDKISIQSLIQSKFEHKNNLDTFNRFALRNFSQKDLSETFFSEKYDNDYKFYSRMMNDNDELFEFDTYSIRDKKHDWSLLEDENGVKIFDGSNYPMTKVDAKTDIEYRTYSRFQNSCRETREQKFQLEGHGFVREFGDISHAYPTLLGKLIEGKLSESTVKRYQRYISSNDIYTDVVDEAYANIERNVGKHWQNVRKGIYGQDPDKVDQLLYEFSLKIDSRAKLRNLVKPYFNLYINATTKDIDRKLNIHPETCYSLDCQVDNAVISAIDSFFRKKFPEIYTFLRTYKTKEIHDSRTGRLKRVKMIARDLQAIETETINKITDRLHQESIPCVTLHDSVYVGEKDLNSISFKFDDEIHRLLKF